MSLESKHFDSSNGVLALVRVGSCIPTSDGPVTFLRFTSVMDLMAMGGEGQSKDYEVHLMIPVGQMLLQQVKKDGFAIMHLTSMSDKIFYAQAVYVPFDGVKLAEAKASFQDEMHAAKGVLEQRKSLKRSCAQDEIMRLFTPDPKRIRKADTLSSPARSV